MESPTVLFTLWLRMIREYAADRSSPQLNTYLINLFGKYKEVIMNDEPIIFVEIVEEYFLSGLLIPRPDDLLSVFKSVLNENSLEHRHRLATALFSLYFSYSTFTNSFVQEIVQLCMKELIELVNKISRSYNTLRTQIMLIINHHIITFGP